MGTLIEQNAERLQISLPAMKHSRSSRAEGLTEQLLVLAEVYRESLTPEQIAIYVEAVSDLSDDQIRLAVGRAVRELEWFPKPAQLREFAGASAKDRRNAEAEAAWEFVNAYLREWGVAQIPIYSAGKMITAPDLPPRITYALRRIGGLVGLNRITEEKRPFMYKDFCEAYALAPIAESMAPQLMGEFRIEGQVKQLTVGVKVGQSHKTEPTRAMMKPKPVPAPMTDSEIRDRREILRQQAERVKAILAEKAKK